MTTPETSPVLYILMRQDLPSLNSGKGMAAASHAANAFLHELPDYPAQSPSHGRKQVELVGDWKMQTPQGFGTVLVLGVTETQMRTAVKIANSLGFINGVVHDPTYPILVPPELGMYLTDNMLDQKKLSVGDNHNYVTIPLDPCAYIFGDKNDPMLEAVVGNFPLHP